MKYPQLYNKKWLYQKYVIENLSQKHIAKLVGAPSSSSVQWALKKSGIPIRKWTKKELKCYKHGQLDDKVWLKTKYETEGLSTNEIARLVGAKSANSVRQALLRHGLRVRNPSEGIRYNREDMGFSLDKEVIEGSLLGDAGLACWNRKSSISQAYFYKKNKYKDHVDLVAKALFPKTWEDRVNSEFDTRYKLTYWGLRTLTYPEITALDKIWYPKSNNFVKVIPKDIDPTPVMLLHWFLDDGSSYQRRKKSKTKQICLTFCTESFTKQDQEMFAAKLKQKFGFRFRIGRVNFGTGWRMFLVQSQAQKFFDLIGPPPIKSLSYKWK